MSQRRRRRSYSLLLLLAASGAGAAVQLPGLEGDLQDNTRAYLTLAGLGCAAPHWLVRQAYQDAPGEIRHALEALGYYEPTIQPSLDLTAKDCWQARFEIQAGAPAILRTLSIEVRGAEEMEAVLQNIAARQPLRTGAPAHHGHYSGLKQALIDESTRLGYFDARFEHSEMRIFPEQSAAEVILVLNTGPRYRIGAISLEQDVLRSELVHHYLTFDQGEYYDAADIRQSYANLAGSGYFDRVLVEPELQIREGGTLPVTVTLEGVDRRVIETGVGFATDTGPRLRGDLNYQRLNSRGHRSHSALLLSAVRSTLTTSYEVPYGDPRSQWLVYDAAVEYEDTDTSESARFGLGARRTTLRFGWKESLFVEARYEDFEIGLQNDDSRLLLIGGTWARSAADNDLRPTRGQRFNLGLRGASNALLSDTDFIQLTAEAKFIRSLGPLRFLARLDAGTTWKDDLAELPPSVRFFAGGDSSIRGYDYQALGPEVAGEVVGGSHKLTGSLETDFAFRSRWALALFADAGTVYNADPQLYRSVGIGFRWFSPVGPIRVDLAHPLDDDTAVRLHISLGPDL